MLTLAALAILYTNDRLANARLRGLPTLQTESIIFLAICGAIVALSAKWLRGPWEYILGPVTALVIVVAYMLGTARFD
jgi:hypothetical protein